MSLSLRHLKQPSGEPCTIVVESNNDIKKITYSDGCEVVVCGESMQERHSTYRKFYMYTQAWVPQTHSQAQSLTSTVEHQRSAISKKLSNAKGDGGVCSTYYHLPNSAHHRHTISYNINEGAPFKELIFGHKTALCAIVSPVLERRRNGVLVCDGLGVVGWQWLVGWVGE